MSDSPAGGPGVGNDVRVARLDGAGGAAEPVPVARFGAAGPGSASAPPADLSAIGDDDGDRARVVALPAGGRDGGADPDSGTGVAPIAHFDAEQVSARRDSGQVVEFDEAARRGRRPATGRGPVGSGPPRSVPVADRVPDSDSAGPPAGEAASDGSPGRRAARRGSPTARSTAGRRPPGELDPDADPVAVARAICLSLLTARARTRQELAQALSRKGVPDEAAHSVLERFDEVGLIDDAAFAGQWVRSRHNSKGLARRAIAMELRRKGVDDEVAGEALAEVDSGSEERRARELVDRKLRRLTVDSTEQHATAARRLVGMLARKGYGGGIAYRVVREALAAHGTDADELVEDPPVD